MILLAALLAYCPCINLVKEEDFNKCKRHTEIGGVGGALEINAISKPVRYMSRVFHKGIDYTAQGE